MTPFEKPSGSQINGQSAEIILRPVGVVKNQTKEPFLKAGEGGLEMEGKLSDVSKRVQEIKHGLSEIIIHEELIGTLEGIEEYSHMVVLYWAHKASEKSRSLTKIHPMGRAEIPLTGVFTTCSPARPNPVLMTVVRLRERRENVLTVSGLDAIDGSPVLDIKPYVKDFYPREEVAIAPWMQKIIDEVGDGEA